MAVFKMRCAGNSGHFWPLLIVPLSSWQNYAAHQPLQLPFPSDLVPQREKCLPASGLQRPIFTQDLSPEVLQHQVVAEDTEPGVFSQTFLTSQSISIGEHVLGRVFLASVASIMFDLKYNVAWSACLAVVSQRLSQLFFQTCLCCRARMTILCIIQYCWLCNEPCCVQYLRQITECDHTVAYLYQPADLIQVHAELDCSSETCFHMNINHDDNVRLAWVILINILWQQLM